MMDLQAAVSPEVSAPLQYAGPVFTHPYDLAAFYPKGRRKNDAILPRPRRPALYTWALFLSLLLLVSLILSCFRALRVGTSARNAGRRLAAGWLTDEEDPEQSAVVEICLDLQQATGTLHQAPAPLPSPEQAITQIISDLKRHATEADAVTPQPAGALQEQTPSFFFPQPGSSRVERAASGSDVTKSGQEAHGHAVPAAPWGASSVPFPAEFSPFSQPVYEFLQPATLPLQALEPLTAQQQQEGRSAPAYSAAGPLLPAAPHQSPPFQTSEEEFGNIRAAPGQKRKATEPGESEPEAPAKLARVQEEPPQPQPQPQPKKHTSGWKGRGPLSAGLQGSPEREAHGSPLMWQQAQEPPSQEPEEDPFLSILQTLPYVWSPEPLDLAEFFHGPSPEGSECEEEEEGGGLHGKGGKAEVEGAHFQQVAGAAPPTVAVSSGLSPPSTSSQVVRTAAPAYPEDPLIEPSPSGLACVESSSDENSGDYMQGAFPGVSPGVSPQMPPAVHLFYRLPVVVPGVTTKKFEPEWAFLPKNVAAHGFDELGKAHYLLTKPEITAREADMLVGYTEVLVGRILYELETPVDPHGPSRAVGKLGRIFLYMDTIISAINLLGPQMQPDSWWPRLASRIFPQTVYEASRKARYLSTHHAALATRLSSALQILKTRARLSPDETVALKRELFCNPRSINDFKKIKWDPWRDDDAKSRDPAAP